MLGTTCLFMAGLLHQGEGRVARARLLLLPGSPVQCTHLLVVHSLSVPNTSDAAPPPPQEFELTVEIDRLLEEMDKDASGTVDYSEFKALLSAA